MIIDEEYYLEHFGVKGMRWGVRRQTRKESNKELKEVVSKNKSAEKIASRDPTFKREVKAIRSGQGISGSKVSPEKTKVFNRQTGRLTGEFVNSKGEPISVDFANAVLSKAAKQREFQERVAAGALFATALLTPIALKNWT